jgi:hypothetical protein
MMFHLPLLLASTLTVLAGGDPHLSFAPAPSSGDLIRKGLHPVVILVPSKGRDHTLLSPLAPALKQAGFAVVALDSSARLTRIDERLAAVRKAIGGETALDPTRVYLVGYGNAAAATAQSAALSPKGLAGMVWFTPKLSDGHPTLASQIPKLPAVPALLIGDVRERASLRMTRTLLKLRASAVTLIVRAGLDGEGGYLQRSPGLADQVALVLRGWAEANCDRTAPKPHRPPVDEHCKVRR